MYSVTEGAATYCVCDDWRAEFTSSWFDPGFWGDAAKPVTAGGRGGAWFVSGSQGDMVLRYYSRGGLIARISRQSYFYTGMSRTRSMSELNLTQQLYKAGFPVPEPIAAAIWRQGCFYHAAILIRRLPASVALGAVANTLSSEHWRSVGHTLRQFHDHCVDHADLNCFNILLSDHQVSVIDFDRGRLRKPEGQWTRWREHNLARLHRSLRKLHDLEDSILDQGWQSLMEGYRTG